MNKNSQIREFRAQGEPDIEASWSAIAMDGHSAMAAMQDGRRSGRFPENESIDPKDNKTSIYPCAWTRAEMLSK